MAPSALVESSHERLVLGLAYGIGAGAMWGLVLLAPAVTRDFAPIQLATARYLFYGLISAILVAPRWRILVAKLTGRHWLTLAGLALAGNTLYYVLLSMAVQIAGVATASLVIGFLPLTVAMVGRNDARSPPLRALVPALTLCAAAALCVGLQTLGVWSRGMLVRV